MSYEPREYWTSRLARTEGLRATGHIAYPESYNRWIYRRKSQVLRRALALAGGPRSAVDLGTGTGWVVDQLARSGVDVLAGCDIAPGAVERLTQTFPGIPFFVAELGRDRLPLADATTDCITLIDVCYHIVDDKLVAGAIAEAARLLRSGGALIVIDAFSAQDASPASHVRFRSLATWSRLADDHGLSVPRILPLYRWLSRSPAESRLRHCPPAVRGATEWLLEQIRPTPAHLSIAVLLRR